MLVSGELREGVGQVQVTIRRGPLFPHPIGERFEFVPDRTRGSDAEREADDRPLVEATDGVSFVLGGWGTERLRARKLQAPVNLLLDQPDMYLPDKGRRPMVLVSAHPVLWIVVEKDSVVDRNLADGRFLVGAFHDYLDELDAIYHDTVERPSIPVLILYNAGLDPARAVAIVQESPAGSGKLVREAFGAMRSLGDVVHTLN